MNLKETSPGDTIAIRGRQFVRIDSGGIVDPRLDSDGPTFMAGLNEPGMVLVVALDLGFIYRFPEDTACRFS
jgi:hypothetical protein